MSSGNSTDIRKKGNEAVQAKKWAEALRLYVFHFGFSYSDEQAKQMGSREHVTDSYPGTLQLFKRRRPWKRDKSLSSTAHLQT